MKSHVMLIAILGTAALAACGGQGGSGQSAVLNGADANAAVVDAAVAQPAQAPTASAPIPIGHPSKNPDMTGLAAQVDANHDGKLSEAEWRAQALPDSSFRMFEKGRGFVTLDDYRGTSAPPGIDLNQDGKLTVEEFREFDRSRQNRPAGTPQP